MGMDIPAPPRLSPEQFEQLLARAMQSGVSEERLHALLRRFWESRDQISLSGLDMDLSAAGFTLDEATTLAALRRVGETLTQESFTAAWRAENRSGPRAARAPLVIEDCVWWSHTIRRTTVKYAQQHGRTREEIEDVVTKACAEATSPLTMGGNLQSDLWGVVGAWRGARQTFVIRPHVQDMLMRTSVEGLEGVSLRLPYDALWVALPGCRLQLSDPAGGSLPLGGVGLRARPGGPRPVVNPMSGERIFPDLTPLDVVMWAPPPPDADPEDDVVVLSTWAQEDLLAGRIARLEAWIQDERGVYTEVTLAVAHLVLNLILYMNMPDGDAREAEESKRWAYFRTRIAANPRRGVKYGVQPDFTVVELGGSIPPPEEASGGTGTSLRRHWVRGHWRRQWVGGVEERRQDLRWVRPHLRGGAEGDPTPERRYETGLWAGWAGEA